MADNAEVTAIENFKRLIEILLQIALPQHMGCKAVGECYFWKSELLAEA